MWVVWRQQRSIVIAFALLAVVVSVWALIMGLHEQTLWREYLSAPCKGEFGGLTTSDAKFCEHVQLSLYNSGKLNEVVIGFGMTFAPLFGLILGVSAVAHEIEQKTNRLAWTQSGSRTRWLMNKYLMSFVSLVVILVPLCWLLSWWVGAAHAAPRIMPKVFAVSGFIEVACGIFCFVLAVVVGLLVRRPGWSLAAAAVLFAAIFLGFFSSGVLLDLGSPSVVVLQGNGVEVGSSSGFIVPGGAPANSWPFSEGFISKSEKGIPSTSVLNRSASIVYRCEDARKDGKPAHSDTYCLKHLGLIDVQWYIPDSQYWALQSFEGGFYLIAAALLGALSLFVVRRAKA